MVDSGQRFNPSVFRTAGAARATGALPCLLLLAMGCSNDNPLGRMPVSGSVTLGSKPLALGNITFAPQDAGGVSSGASIIEGQYSIPEVQGLPPGKYVVRLYSAEKDNAPATPEEMARMPELRRPGLECISPEYNVNSNKIIEVTTDGPNQFNFQIPTNK